MSRTFIGCSNRHAPLATYSKRFSIIELAPFSADTLPRAQTLKKWRSEVPPSFAFSLVAPAPVALGRPGEALDAGVASLLEFQRALQAQFLLLRSPVEVTPSPVWRERIERVVATIRHGLGDASQMVSIAWEARGVWEAQEAGDFAQNIGISLAADPLLDPREPFWHASLNYVRPRAMPGRTHYSTAHMQSLAELFLAIRSKEPRAVIFDTPEGSRDAAHFARLVRDGGSSGARANRPASYGGSIEEQE